jgi:hypothetical protein
MESKGIQIEKCPRCRMHGLLIERITVTKSGSKKYTYKRLNVAHYGGYGISKNGKPVDRIHWCYLNAEQLKQLQNTSVTQTVRQNVTQTVTQNENRDLSFFSGNVGSPGEIRTPVGGSKARHACPLQSAERRCTSLHRAFPGSCVTRVVCYCSVPVLTFNFAAYDACAFDCSLTDFQIQKPSEETFITLQWLPCGKSHMEASPCE